MESEAKKTAATEKKTAAGTKKTNSSGGTPTKTALTVGVKQSYKSEKKTVSID